MKLNPQTVTILPTPQLVTPMAMDWVMAASISASSTKTPHFGAIIQFKWSIFVMTRLVKQPMRLTSAFQVAIEVRTRPILTVMGTACQTDGKLLIGVGLALRLMEVIIGHLTQIEPKTQIGMQTVMVWPTFANTSGHSFVELVLKDCYLNHMANL